MEETVPVSVPPDAVLASEIAEALELSRENNRLLRRMIRMGRIAFWIKVVVWAIVLGLPLLFIGPILTFITNHAGGGTTLFGYPSPAEVQKFIAQYKGK